MEVPEAIEERDERKVGDIVFDAERDLRGEIVDLGVCEETVEDDFDLKDDIEEVSEKVPERDGIFVVDT